MFYLCTYLELQLNLIVKISLRNCFPKGAFWSRLILSWLNVIYIFPDAELWEECVMKIRGNIVKIICIIHCILAKATNELQTD